MRQYRAKVKSDKSVISKRWAYGDKVKIGARVYIVLPDAEVDSHSHGEEYIIGIIEVIPESVGQGTGKTDINDKDIYQGDIGKDGGVIIWSEDSAGFLYDHPDEIQDLYETQSWLEIVGNTTDDPGLLKEQDHD